MARVLRLRKAIALGLFVLLTGCNAAEPEVEPLGFVPQTTTTQMATSTTRAPTTSIDRSPQVAIYCPSPDAGAWDWYDAGFAHSLDLYNEFSHARIDYGDGRSYSSSTAEDAKQNMFWHRYSSDGTFVVTVSVTDVAGRTGSGSCTFQWTDTRGSSSAGQQATATSCDTNYEGACVPIASDVDCSGGSGNGPAYVRGPVYVVGSDIYGLDRDNDGVGCE